MFWVLFLFWLSDSLFRFRFLISLLEGFLFLLLSSVSVVCCSKVVLVWFRVLGVWFISSYESLLVLFMLGLEKSLICGFRVVLVIVMLMWMFMFGCMVSMFSCGLLKGLLKVMLLCLILSFWL